MAKKIVVTLQVSPAALALRGFSLGLDQHTPPLSPWTQLAPTARALARQVASGCRLAARATAALRGRRGLRLRPVPAGDPLALRRLELQLDVPTLLAQREGTAALQRLFTLLESIAQAGWWQIDARIGSRTRATSLPPVLAELTAQAAALDVVLTPAPAPGPPRPEAAASRPPPAEKKKPGSRPKKPRPPTGGSFGGLPDDEVGAGPATTGDGSGEEASFFLSYGRLTWPCAEAELRLVHRQIVKTLHPDRHPDDPGASHRFMLLQRGYEALRARLDG